MADNKLKEALAQIEQYVERRKAMPLRNIGDSVHAIHSGTEYEAEVTFSALCLAQEEIARLRTELTQCKRELENCGQAAGKALGYPWFKDDQKNFPGATEDNGVCIGEHTSATIVEELADNFARLQAERDRAVAWPISVDGPHKITDQRAWLARQLMDSKNSDEEAFGIVAYHPAIREDPHPSLVGREEVARVIASALGDDFDHAFVNKSEWNRARGEKGGRYRDINEPMQDDYLAAADALLALFSPADGWRLVPDEPTEEMARAARGMLMAIQIGMPSYRTALGDVDDSGVNLIYRAMLDAAPSVRHASPQ